MDKKKKGSCRAISSARLHTLLHFHLHPINVVIFYDPQGNTHLEVGFVLRCFQRLSIPHIATQRCSWRHNWYTRGASIPVLSYWRQIFSIFLRPQQIETELSCDVLNPARVPL